MQLLRIAGVSIFLSCFDSAVGMDIFGLLSLVKRPRTQTILADVSVVEVRYSVQKAVEILAKMQREEELPHAKIMLQELVSLAQDKMSEETIVAGLEALAASPDLNITQVRDWFCRHGALFAPLENDSIVCWLQAPFRSNE